MKKRLDNLTEEFNIPHRFDEEYFHSIIKKAQKRGTIYRFVDKTIVNGLKNLDLQERVKNRTRILYASNHRSHLDYLILAYVIDTNNLPIPRFAAGQNLLIWPLNKIIDLRKMGAFSIDRDIKTYDYLKALYTHIEDILISGQSILFFPEGGRSYNTEYGKPKTGLIRAVIGAIKKEEHKNNKLRIDVVPININYDNVAEKPVFNLLKKTKKVPKIGKLLYYLLDGYVIGKRYIFRNKGKAYVRFGSPRDIETLGKNKKQVAEAVMELIKNLDK